MHSEQRIAVVVFSSAPDEQQAVPGVGLHAVVVSAGWFAQRHAMNHNGTYFCHLPLLDLAFFFCSDGLVLDLTEEASFLCQFVDSSI